LFHKWCKGRFREDRNIVVLGTLQKKQFSSWQLICKAPQIQEQQQSKRGAAERDADLRAKLRLEVQQIEQVWKKRDQLPEVQKIN
jgi:hypothetical protein